MTFVNGPWKCYLCHHMKGSHPSSSSCHCGLRENFLMIIQGWNWLSEFGTGTPNKHVLELKDQ